MTYVNYTDLLKFPSGRSIGNCKKDTRKAHQKTGQSISSLLNEIAQKNFENSSITWDKAINLLLVDSINKVSNSQAEMAFSDLDQLSKTHRKITQYGIGVSSIAISRDLMIESQLTGAQALEKQHEMLFSPSSLDEFNSALKFLNCLRPSLKLNKNKYRTSYELKHTAENFLSIASPYSYISHGTLIAAALFMGYLPERLSVNSLSVFFNIDENSLVEVDDFYLSQKQLQMNNSDHKPDFKVFSAILRGGE
jgi:hypothetical protein